MYINSALISAINVNKRVKLQIQLVRNKNNNQSENRLSIIKMELTFLGTASRNPTPKRGVSSTVLRMLNGENWMFDCGEGTQTQVMKSHLKACRISKIFITHLHGDHLFGLPGFMCTMSQGVAIEGGKLVEVYGPTGLRKYLRVSLELSRSTFTFSYVVHELVPPTGDFPEDWENWHPEHTATELLHPNEQQGRDIIVDDQGCWHLFEDEKISVCAAPLTHKVPCFGFVIEEKPLPGRLNVDFLMKKGIPSGPLYGQLKLGGCVTSPSGEVITAADALAESTPGCKIVILGDTKDSTRIGHLAANADVLVHEATLNNQQVDKCVENGHSTPAMAVTFARSIDAKQLILNHVSQRFKPLSETCENGEETVGLLLNEARDETLGYCGKVVLAQDLDVFKIQRSRISRITIGSEVKTS